MTPAGRQSLVAAVQTNCHIADARHAADLTLCNYLLQMREFYRWEQGLPFGAPLARDAVGAWLAEREALWADLEASEFLALPDAQGRAHDPFDVVTINAALQPDGLLYGAGLVGRGRPVFFLAELHGREQCQGLEVHRAGRELARGLVSPPAALGWAGDARAMVLRRESLARWCWERFEAFTLRRTPGSPFAEVVRAYGLDHDFEAALPRWLDEQSEAVVLHELGEFRAGQWLDPGWSALRLALPDRRGDLYARAVRDHLADLDVTLPALLDRHAEGAIHFWFATFDGVRQTLYPSLVAAYEAWRAGDGGSALRRACTNGLKHFEAVAAQALRRHAAEGDAGAAAIGQWLASADAVCPAG